MAEFPCSQSSATIDQLSRGYECLSQLLALLSTSPAKPSATTQAILLVDKAMSCIAAALSELQNRSPHCIDSPTAAEDTRNVTDPRKRSMKRKQSWTIVTSVPHFDGHQWRKYGQKRIHSSEFPRCYYKCTHSKDQGCQATKTIQQKEDKVSNPPKYVVSYSVHHTCKAKETPEIPFVMDSSAIVNGHSTSSSRAASADLSPALPPQAEDIEQVRLMESLFILGEQHDEANGFESFSALSPRAALNFDWEDPTN